MEVACNMHITCKKFPLGYRATEKAMECFMQSQNFQMQLKSAVHVEHTGHVAPSSLTPVPPRSVALFRF